MIYSFLQFKSVFFVFSTTLQTTSPHYCRHVMPCHFFVVVIRCTFSSLPPGEGHIYAFMHSSLALHMSFAALILCLRVSVFFVCIFVSVSKPILTMISFYFRLFFFAALTPFLTPSSEGA